MASEAQYERPICAVPKFLDAVGRPIKHVTRSDVEQFLLAQARDGRAPRTRNIYLASIRWLLRASGRRDVTALLRQASISKALGTVLSGSDVERLLAAITSLKYRAILMTAYGAGLRIGELPGALVCLLPAFERLIPRQWAVMGFDHTEAHV